MGEGRVARRGVQGIIRVRQASIGTGWLGQAKHPVTRHRAGELLPQAALIRTASGKLPLLATPASPRRRRSQAQTNFADLYRRSALCRRNTEEIGKLINPSLTVPHDASTVRFETAAGETVDIAVPTGLQPGQTFELLPASVPPPKANGSDGAMFATSFCFQFAQLVKKWWRIFRRMASFRAIRILQASGGVRAMASAEEPVVLWPQPKLRCSARPWSLFECTTQHVAFECTTQHTTQRLDRCRLRQSHF